MSVHSSRGPKWEALRKAVLERDNYICHWDGAYATEADHLTPKSKGGRDELSNLVASCKSCNARRGDSLITRTNWFNPRWFPNGTPW